jgi:formate dehydrogenase iron-sulfur subunit
LPESQFDTPLDYEAFASIWAVLGHGGIVAFDDTVDMAEMARYSMEFCVKKNPAENVHLAASVQHAVMK